MWESDVCLRDIINKVLVGHLCGLVENVKTGIFADAINIKICMMLLLLNLYLFRPLSVTLVIFLGHSNIEQLTCTNYCVFFSITVNSSFYTEYLLHTLNRPCTI